MSCECEDLFKSFHWTDLSTVNVNEIPKSPGVYVIRVNKKGSSVKKAISQFEEFLNSAKWKAFAEYLTSRLKRLKNINECPIIYIGAAPNGLRHRFRDLCGRRHTAFFPTLALLLAGWKLDFGWIESENAEVEEERLKREYRNLHNHLPALVKR